MDPLSVFPISEKDQKKIWSQSKHLLQESASPLGTFEIERKTLGPSSESDQLQRCGTRLWTGQAHKHSGPKRMRPSCRVCRELRDALQSHSGVILLGSHGTGKSTLLKRTSQDKNMLWIYPDAHSVKDIVGTWSGYNRFQPGLLASMLYVTGAAVTYEHERTTFGLHRLSRCIRDHALSLDNLSHPSRTINLLSRVLLMKQDQDLIIQGTLKGKNGLLLRGQGQINEEESEEVVLRLFSSPRRVGSDYWAQSPSSLSVRATEPITKKKAHFDVLREDFLVELVD
eukprot:g1313.t1